MQDGRVIPLLLDLDFKEVSGPLAQFQAKKADNPGIKELVASLNKAASSPVPDAQLDKLFPALWGDLDKQITAIPSSGTQTKHSRPQGEILEELVSSIRTVELRMRDAMDDDPIIRKRRRLRFHPMMMHEFMHRIAERPGDPVQMLFAGSLLRDEAPWIYELALEAYHAVRSGSRESGQIAVKRFVNAIEILQRGPFAEELGVDRMSLKMLQSTLSEILELVEFPKERTPTRLRKRPISAVPAQP